MPSAVLDIRYFRAVNTTDKNCAPEELTVSWTNLCKMCTVSGRESAMENRKFEKEEKERGVGSECCWDT